VSVGSEVPPERDPLSSKSERRLNWDHGAVSRARGPMMVRAIERLRASSVNYYSNRSLYSDLEDDASVDPLRSSSAPRLHLHQQQVGPCISGTGVTHFGLLLKAPMHQGHMNQ
jgi:hypothetical protein